MARSVVTGADNREARHREKDRRVVDEADKARIRSLATDVPRLWCDPGTPDRERKRVVRLLLEDVTLLRTQGEMVAQVRFSGGATRTLRLPRPPSAGERSKLSQVALAEMDRLLDHHTEIERSGAGRLDVKDGRRLGRGNGGSSLFWMGR
jgi:hypothetical protein